MISKVMQEALNEQINKELFSSYLYLSMAAYFENRNLPGFAKWMRIQADEEREHAMKIFDHVLERGGEVNLKAIATPEHDWKSELAAFEAALEHERFISKSIHDLYELASKEKDYPAQVMLQWFITEQVEEEANATAVVENLKRVQAHETAVLMLDHRLGKREEEEEE